MRKTPLSLAVLLLAVAVLAACATTRVTSVWKDKSYQGRPHKILVYAVLGNGTNRRIIEDAFVSHFKSWGIDAIPAYDVVPGEELAKKEVLDEKLKASGFDTLLLTQLTGSKDEQVHTGDIVNYQSMPSGMYEPMPYYGTWPAYYNTVYITESSPIYTTEKQYVMAEANLYDVTTEKLIWRAATEIKVRENDQRMLSSYVATIMEALRKQKVVP